MLVLTRNVGQSIMIGDDTKITILEADEGRRGVKLGIDAPLSIMVHRSEIFEKIRLEKLKDTGYEQR